MVFDEGNEIYSVNDLVKRLSKEADDPDTMASSTDIAELLVKAGFGPFVVAEMSQEAVLTTLGYRLDSGEEWSREAVLQLTKLAAKVAAAWPAEEKS